MKKKKNKKRNQKFAERPGANLPSSQELTEAPSNEPIRNDPHSERVDDEFEDDQRWIAVTPPDPWYSPHFWAISVEDPSAERMRETLIAANVLRALGHEAPADWILDADPRPAPTRREQLAYTRAHVLPWIGRRLTGRSSGDGRTALMLHEVKAEPAARPKEKYISFT